MNEFKAHIPRCTQKMFDVVESIPFSTTEELLDIPYVRGFCEHGPVDEEFSHYSINDTLLMAVYKKGYWWCVVGFLKEPVLDLPVWTGGKYLGWDAEYDTSIEIDGCDVIFADSDRIYHANDKSYKNLLSVKYRK